MGVKAFGEPPSKVAWRARVQALRDALGDEGQWAVIMTEAEVASRAKTVSRTAGTVLEKQAADEGDDD